MALLGIEIGGTKLQLGVSEGDGREIQLLLRYEVCLEQGGQGIRDQIEAAVRDIRSSYQIDAVGVGFGGPVSDGVTNRSHQVSGWDDFPLADWCRRLVAPAVIRNDCDCAALAEAKWGAGRSANSMFYITVGTGIGGGFVLEGKLQGEGRPSIAEIGHLRLRPGAGSDQIVEAEASGTGIELRARTAIERQQLGHKDLLARAESLEKLTAKHVAEAAGEGNPLALEVLAHATGVLGWAIAQMATLLAPQLVVIGGGVSLMPAELFLEPLRKSAQDATFGPLRDAYKIVRAELGESVVVHGALALAAESTTNSQR